MIYDFIIFEHSGLRNHFVDLCSIGKMLRDCEYIVGIANVTNELEECKDCGLPILLLKIKREHFKSDDTYMQAVFNELSPMTKYFYVGSVLSSTRLTWLKYIPKDKKVFLWALRSFFFTEFKRPKLRSSWPACFVSSIYNKYVTKKNKNIRFFVSDPIIRDEFVTLGYDAWRIVIRQERTCTVFHPTKQRQSHPLEILSIGALRPEKRIDLCMKAIDELNSIHYTIAGKAYTIKGYNKKLDSMASERSYVTRNPALLSTHEYNYLINKCDYLVLSDEKQASCVTNGTMAEALLAGRPIIAPNYNPYKYIIEKYGVGIMYEMHNHESLVAAFRKALITDPAIYVEGIMRYQEDLMYNKVISDFAIKMKETLKK